MSKKKETPFNNPFAQVKLKDPPKPPDRPVVKVAPPKSKPVVDDESMLFLESVGEVAPVRKGSPVVGAPVGARVNAPAEDAESLTRLAELVSTNVVFEFEESVEHVEAWVRGFDERVRRKLKRGEFKVEAELDLHGHQKASAKAELDRFFESASREGRRCVAVITGRGLHSQGGEPVLKQGAVQWLTQGRWAKQVLALCTAPAHSGGTGAIWVLLRARR